MDSKNKEEAYTFSTSDDNTHDNEHGYKTGSVKGQISELPHSSKNFDKLTDLIMQNNPSIESNEANIPDSEDAANSIQNPKKNKGGRPRKKKRGGRKPKPNIDTDEEDMSSNPAESGSSRKLKRPKLTESRAEAHRLAVARYNANNPEARKITVAKYAATHAEAHRQSVAKYNATHREERRMAAARYRAKKKAERLAMKYANEVYDVSIKELKGRNTRSRSGKCFVEVTIEPWKQED